MHDLESLSPGPPGAVRKRGRESTLLRTVRSCAPIFAILFSVTGGAAAAISGCSKLPDVTPGCSNFVVEPELEEDCDESTADSPRETGTARPARCAKVGEADACHYVADATHACPLGFHVGVGARVCVRASGAFAAPSPRMANLLGKSPQVLDVDLDGQLDLVLDGVHDDFTAPYFLEQPSDGRYEVTVGAAEPLHAAFVDLSGDGVPDVAAPAPDYSGLVVRLRHLDRSDEARIFEHQVTAGRLRYAWAPRADSPTDALVALFDGASSTPCGAGVCGCVVGRTGCETPFTAPWLAPPALVGLHTLHARTGTLIAPEAGGLRFAADADGMLAGEWVSIPSADYYGGAALRDLDGDGVEDIGFVQCASVASFALSKGPFSMATPPLVASVATTTSSCIPEVRAHGPAFGFVDADASLDLALLPSLWTSSNGATTGFLPPSDRDVLPLGDQGRWPEHHALGDVNGDLRDDLVVAVGSGGSAPKPPTMAAVFLGAEGAPLASQTYSTALPLKLLAISDLDGDGLGDIVGVIGAAASEACDASPDEVLVAYGRASGYPEPWRSIGRFPGVEQIAPGRWTPKYEVDAYGDVAIASTCADHPRGRGAILRGDPGRRPFSVLELANDDSTPADIVRALAAPELAAALGRPSSVVVTGLGGNERVAFVLPFTGRADARPDERLALPLPAPTTKTAETLLQAITSLPEDPGAFVAGGLEADGPKRRVILFTGRVDGEVNDRLDLLDLTPASNATWSLASLPPSDLDPVRRYAVVARDVAAPEVASGLFFFSVDEGGQFVDVGAAPPTGDGAFVGVTTLEGERGERALVVATDGGIYRFDPLAETLTPFLAGGAPLVVDGVTAIAAGDFSGDGLDDLLVIADGGGFVVPQVAKTPAQP